MIETSCNKTVQPVIPKKCTIQPHIRKFNFTASNFIKKFNTIQYNLPTISENQVLHEKKVGYISTEITTKP